MAPVVAPSTPPASPRSPPRKRAKFSLRLKGRNKPKNDDDGEKSKDQHVYPLFSSPSKGNDENQDENNLMQEPEIPSLPYAGLLNQGNTCYANAVLQVLRCCPGFQEFVGHLAKECKETDDVSDVQVKEKKDETEQLVLQLDELLCQMNTFEEDFSDDRENCIHLCAKGNSLVLAVETFGFMEAFRELYPAFESNLQHDAQEFLCSLIMALQESATKKAKKEKTSNTNCTPSYLPKGKQTKRSDCTCDGSFKSDNFSVVSSMESLFQGKLVHQTKCLNCEDSKLRYEDFQDVSVPVVEDQPYLDARKKLMLSPTPKKNKDNLHTLQWAISQFASSECLQGDNKYFCENCNTYCEAEIRTCFDKLPIILTVHLKRFTSSVGLSSKITSNLQTPFILSVQEWCSKKCQLEKSVYELFGIVVHSGMTSGSGHYETYVRITNNNSKFKGMESVANSNEHVVQGLEDKGEIVNGSHCCERNFGKECEEKHGLHNGILQNETKLDINGNNFFEETEEKVKSNAKSKRKRGRKTESGIENGEIKDTDSTVNDSLKSPKALKKESKRKRTQDCDVDKDPETEASPLEGKTNAQTSFMSRITKYFQRSRKVSTRSEKRVKPRLDIEKTDLITETEVSPKEKSTSTSSMNLDAKNLEEEGIVNTDGEVTSEESSSKENPLNPKIYGSIESYFKATNSLQQLKSNSKSPAIRKLYFQGNSDGDEVCNGNSELHRETKYPQSKNSDEDVQITYERSQYIENLKAGWVHFDDCTVNQLNEQDIALVLSSSDSSFSSPYLLFYQKMDAIKQ